MEAGVSEVWAAEARTNGAPLEGLWPASADWHRRGARVAAGREHVPNIAAVCLAAGTHGAVRSLVRLIVIVPRTLRAPWLGRLRSGRGGYRPARGLAACPHGPGGASDRVRTCRQPAIERTQFGVALVEPGGEQRQRLLGRWRQPGRHRLRRRLAPADPRSALGWGQPPSKSAPRHKRVAARDAVSHSAWVMNPKQNASGRSAAPRPPASASGRARSRRRAAQPPAQSGCRNRPARPSRGTPAHPPPSQSQANDQG